MSEDTELQDSQPVEEEETPAEDSTESETQDTQPEHTDNEKKLYARLKKTEEELKKYKEKPVEKTVSQPDDIEVVLQLRSEGYSDKEILDLRGEAKKFGRPLQDIVSNKYFKSGIEAERQKAKVEQAIPSPSTRSGLQTSKPFSDMKPDERAKELNFEAWRSKRKGGTV